MHDSKTTDDERQKYQITSVTSQPQSQSHTNPTTNKQPMNQSNHNNHNNDNDKLKKTSKQNQITPKGNHIL